MSQPSGGWWTKLEPETLQQVEEVRDAFWQGRLNISKAQVARSLIEKLNIAASVSAVIRWINDTGGRDRGEVS